MPLRFREGNVACVLDRAFLQNLNLALSSRGDTMARRPPQSGPFSTGAVVAFAGMAAFITGVSAYPRISVARDDNFTTLRYQHRQSTSSGVSPIDPGMIISPGPKGQANSSDSNEAARRAGKPWGDKDWILDTGATTHVCTDASKMHGYTSFAHSALVKSVARFGPNPISIAGMGDCTLALPAPKGSSRVSVNNAFGVERGFSVKGRLTIHNVTHIPGAGINILSWSQLRSTRGLELRLKDNEDGSLGVVSWARGQGTEIMRFVLRDGLYFLDRGEKD